LEFNFLDLGFVLFDEVAGSGNNFLHPCISWIYGCFSVKFLYLLGFESIWIHIFSGKV
jgi:hypothetical protein